MRGTGGRHHPYPTANELTRTRRGRVREELRRGHVSLNAWHRHVVRYARPAIVGKSAWREVGHGRLACCHRFIAIVFDFVTEPARRVRSQSQRGREELRRGCQGDAPTCSETK